MPEICWRWLWLWAARSVLRPRSLCTSFLALQVANSLGPSGVFYILKGNGDICRTRRTLLV